MSFDASTAKPGSQWVTRAGEILTFHTYIASANPLHCAIFITESGMPRTMSKAGQMFNDQSSGFDIIREHIAAQRHQIKDSWVILDKTGGMMVGDLFDDKNDAMNEVKQLIKYNTDDAPYFIIRIPGFSMTTNRDVVDMDENPSPSIADYLRAEAKALYVIPIGSDPKIADSTKQPPLPSEIEKRIEEYRNAVAQLSWQEDQGSKGDWLEAERSCCRDALNKLRQAIHYHLKNESKTNPRKAKCQATELK